MTIDGRPLSVRLTALAARFRAQAEGHRRNARASLQDATNADRDADWITEAVALAKASGR